jgi:hypothetical protein
MACDPKVSDYIAQLLVNLFALNVADFYFAYHLVGPRFQSQPHLESGSGAPGTATLLILPCRSWTTNTFIAQAPLPLLVANPI